TKPTTSPRTCANTGLRSPAANTRTSATTTTPPPRRHHLEARHRSRHEHPTPRPARRLRSRMLHLSETQPIEPCRKMPDTKHQFRIDYILFCSPSTTGGKGRHGLA